jgi:hypothetical protein
MPFFNPVPNIENRLRVFGVRCESSFKRDILYPRISPFFVLVQINIHTLCLKDTRLYPPENTPIRGFDVLRFMFHLLIRFVRQELSCVHSDGFGRCFLTWVCFFNDSRRSSFVRAQCFNHFATKGTGFSSPRSPN